jgi:hypothetical protein
VTDENKPTVGFLRKLIGNPDIYALQHKDGSWHPVRSRLTPAVLQKHARGEHTVGTYIVQPPDQARTLVFDFDEADEKERDRQLNAVATIVNGPLELNAGVEFSGKKGYHLWVVVEDYVPAELLYRIGRGVREEANLPALEVFPKQTHVRDLGNLVKLPGGKHQVTGKANNFLGPLPDVVSVERIEEVGRKYPELTVRRKDAPGSIEFPCVHSIQVGFEEGGRNVHLFHLAVMARKFSLTDENVELVVRNANAKCEPPLDEEELEHILENSKFSGPVCDQLNADVNCGDQCVKARHPGLFTRKGAVKWAADGEEAVVVIRERADDGRQVILEHPDIVESRAILADAPPPKRRGKRADDAGED